MEFPRPSGYPRCRHGNFAGGFRGCPECAADNRIAHQQTTELVALFWEHKGQNTGDLEHLMARAFRAGREYERSLADKQKPDKCAGCDFPNQDGDDVCEACSVEDKEG